MCALCMWGVERGPRASMGRRGAHGDGIVGVFGAVSVAAVDGVNARHASFIHNSSRPRSTVVAQCTAKTVLLA